MIPAGSAKSQAGFRLAVDDEARVIAAYREHAEALGIAPPQSIAAWRLFPLKDGRFLVGYRFDGSHPRPGGTDLFDVYAELSRGATTPAAAGETALRSIEQVGFVLPFDPELPRLPDLIAGKLVAMIEPTLARPGRLVAYRPLSRATLHFRRADGGSAWLRVSASSSRYQRIASRARLASAFAERPAGPRFPRINLELPSHHALLIDHLAGTPLSERLSSVSEADLDAIAAALAALGACDPSGLAPHHGIDEAERTAWMVRRAAAIDPERFAEIDELLVRLFDAAAEVEVPALVPIHRDLHDKQIVLDGTGMAGLLDTDMLAAGDPALDAANLAVHFELREMQGALPADRGRSSSERFLAACRARGIAPSQPRLAFFTACSWLRIAGVYALRSHGRPLVPRLLERARQSLTAC